MLLKVTFLGHASFLVESYDGVKVVTDPFNDQAGYTLPADLKADIVLISRQHAWHNCFQAVGGTPAVIQGPGSRELGWVKVRGIADGNNTIFCWDMRATKFCHLSALNHNPDQALLEQIGPVDILFVPVGSGEVLGPQEAAQIANKLKSRIIIPMIYQTPQNPQLPCALREFISGKNNIIMPAPRNQLTLTREDLQRKEQRIIALEYLEPAVILRKK